MADDLKVCKDFPGHVSNALNNTADYDVDIMFYMTHNCNLACSGCYMHANPAAARDIIPASDIDFYLNEFEKVPGFYNTVVFSGGEIFNDSLVNLERNAHNVLDRGWHLQLKTNGSWIAKPELRNSVFRMLDRLEPGRGMLAGKDEIERFLSRFPKPILRLLGRERVVKLLFKFLPSASLLDLAVSVDDKIHPIQSADWFIDIANALSRDAGLKENVNLKTFSFYDSKDFFDSHVLKNPKIRSGVKNVEWHPDYSCLAYTINGKKIESFFGDFVDTAKVPEFKKISEFVLPSVDGDTNGRLVYCFHPDRTVGLDSCYLESVGRVSYINDKGKRKSFAQINDDIQKKLIQDYNQATK
ncbi:MAG: hypothetical protein II208_00080 [Alphaproteobacteria bacterium]|nr:hypothetical protein [Alphaproteobacteria bacterium]